MVAFRLLICALALAGSTAAQAVGGYYEYTAAPDSPPIYQSFRPNMTVEGPQQFGATFFTLREETVGGPGWSSDRHDLRQEATLTTNAAGDVIAWNIVGSDINRYVEFYWSSSFANGVFQESYRSEEGFITWCYLECETSAASTRPGTWRYVAPTAPVPEPSAYWLALAGLGIALRSARRKRTG